VEVSLRAPFVPQTKRTIVRSISRPVKRLADISIEFHQATAKQLDYLQRMDYEIDRPITVIFPDILAAPKREMGAVVRCFLAER
jgi:hypothetical protein